MTTITGISDNGQSREGADVCDVVAQLVRRVGELERLLAEQKEFLLTFRQSSLIMLGATEECLRLPRSVPPKHRRNN